MAEKPLTPHDQAMIDAGWEKLKAARPITSTQFTPRQSEIDRTLILFYRSNNAHDFTNYTRPVGWLDGLPMKGLEEFASIVMRTWEEVSAEIDKRLAGGMPRYSRKDHDSKQPWTTESS